jgi:hypothetical protein
MTSADNDWAHELIWVAMRKEDEPEYERIVSELVKVLRKLGGYEPGVDDIYVEEIARASVYLKKTEVFLDAGTEDTYSKMADARVKVRKTIDDAMNELAITRRQRLANRTEGDIREELKQALLRGLKHGRAGTK